MIPRPTPEQEPSHENNLQTAATTLAAAQQAVSEARRDLGRTIVAARKAGYSIPRIARYTGLDKLVVRNILAATPPATTPERNAATSGSERPLP
ncbi:hypothetical protein ABZT03_42315 [Streptomyces sp. NPDC005574]|uniref:hypothetical protein n=1 Tax=Streptomyces sp. NPDC005574 TaxID=3156891 RepID=UPI00339E9F40